MTQMLQVSKNGNIKYNIIQGNEIKKAYQIEVRYSKINYTHWRLLIIIDTQTKKKTIILVSIILAYYVAAHHTIQIKNIENMASFI